MKYILKCGLIFLLLSIFFFYRADAQRKMDTALELKLIHLYTWKYQLIPNKGILMFVNFPYNLGDRQQHTQSQYLSISVGLKPNEKQPAFLSFTLPDDATASKGILVGFDSLPVPMQNAQFSLKKLSAVYNIKFYKHWENNHTDEFVIPNGRINDTARKRQINIFGEFMHYRHLYVLFFDPRGLKTMYFPLSFFQQRYEELSSPPPAYSTGNPADTALTAEEMTDKGGEMAPWSLAGISDPVSLKHFIKYFRYLMNHNEKEKIAQLIIFPQDSVNAECRDSADFVRNYDQIFDADLKNHINDQRLNDIFYNIHGVLIGHVLGITINQRGYRYVITSIGNTLMKKELEKAYERYYKKKDPGNE